MELENKVSLLYKNLYFKSVRVERLITILKVIVLDKEVDLRTIAKKANSSVETVKNYINNKKLLLDILNQTEYTQFISYQDKINNKAIREKEQEKYSIIKTLIHDILHTRYKLEEICIRNNITQTIYSRLISDEQYLIDNFGKDIVNKIKFRISETSIIRNSTPRDKYIIEEEQDLKILNDKIHFLGKYEYRILKVVSNYLNSEANISEVAEKLEMPEQMVYNYLTDPKAKDILKKDCFEKLQSYIKIEDSLRNQDLNARRDLIKEVIEELKKCNYDMIETVNNLQITHILLNKILNESLVNVIYSKEEISRIKDLISSDNEEKQERGKKR